MGVGRFSRLESVFPPNRPCLEIPTRGRLDGVPLEHPQSCSRLCLNPLSRGTSTSPESGGTTGSTSRLDGSFNVSAGSSEGHLPVHGRAPSLYRWQLLRWTRCLQCVLCATLGLGRVVLHLVYQSSDISGYEIFRTCKIERNRKLITPDKTYVIDEPIGMD